MNGHQDTSTSADGSSDRVLASCRHHWETSGLAPASIDDLHDELRSHLHEAAKKGRTPEDVIGPDVRAFAREWARAHTPTGKRWARLLINVVCVLAAVALLRHLILRDPELNITPGLTIFVAGLILVLLGWPGRQQEPTFAQFSVAAAVGIIPGFLVDWLLLPDTVLFRLPWWATVAIAVAAFGFAYWENRGRTTPTTTNAD